MRRVNFTYFGQAGNELIDLADNFRVNAAVSNEDKIISDLLALKACLLYIAEAHGLIRPCIFCPDA
jgi:hypothetical protein